MFPPPPLKKNMQDVAAELLHRIFGWVYADVRSDAAATRVRRVCRRFDAAARAGRVWRVITETLWSSHSSGVRLSPRCAVVVSRYPSTSY